MSEMKKTLEKMPIPMIGRINLIKMNVSKFVYPFQSHPLPLPKIYKELNSVVCRFIWNNKNIRFRLKLLYESEWGSAQLRCAMLYFSLQNLLSFNE